MVASDQGWGRGQPARISFVSLLLVRCPVSRGGREEGLAMASTTLHRRAGRSNSVRKSDELIGRAAERAGWAGTALECAAKDLDGACGTDGNALSGLAEVVQDAATRVSNLAEEIRS